MEKNIMTEMSSDLSVRFRQCIASETAEEFLQILLNLMSVVFLVNPQYRANIKGFVGRYQFCSADGQVTMAAIFKDGKMEVKEKMIANPHVTVTFRNGRALLDFLLAPRQDILGSMLRNDVSTSGNLNYLYKFGYMAKKLQLLLTGP
ncbi:MAG: hypothetical protein ACOY4H_11815 [Thermodesulfobacteriota bacterium]